MGDLINQIIPLEDLVALSKHILLVEPDYYTKYPPLGLLKLSSYHKNRDNTTELVRGTNMNVSQEPDIIYITSLWTWAWKPVWEAVRFYSNYFPKSEVWLGGLYASLMPKHASLSGIRPDRIFRGVYADAEALLPDYSLVPKWNQKVGGSIIFSSRGCIRSCPYCAVPQIEGSLNSLKHSIRHLIWPGHRKVIFFDNNFLANPCWESVLNEIEEFDLSVDFNQGLDTRLITRDVARRISELKVELVRLAYDYREMRRYVKRAIDYLVSQGIDGRKILVYALYNFTDDPQDFFDRMRDILQWGAVCYPMRFQPINTLRKNSFIAPKWDAVRLNAVQRARRVIGAGGAFPPYEGMLKVKVQGCKSFDEAFREFMTPLEVIS